MILSPIVLFTYNRLDHTKKTIAALQANDLARDSELFIYADAAKNDNAVASVTAVRDYLRTVDGFKHVNIIERERNWGLADSIVDGVTTLVGQYGSVIVLEDDIVTSPFFLLYMNDALELYKDDTAVMHISGYFFPVDTTGLPETFFYNQTSCWGWATWDRAWQQYEPNAEKLLTRIKSSGRLSEFDMDGQFKFSSTLRANIRQEIKTWAIKWHASVFLQHGLCLHPRQSLTKNIGHDGTGVHSNPSHIYDTTIAHAPYTPLVKIPLTPSPVARLYAINFLKQTKPSIIQRIIKKIWK